MQLERTIADIALKLREGRFPNEQSISQGVVLRVLSDLGWEVYDTNIVWPEYSTGEGRVDFALCAPPEHPKSFIEVKQPGKAEDGVKQALEYAFHTGAQFVTLTDGQTWSFYLPAEPGSYEDRRVFKLDLFERTVDESAKVFRRYLEQNRVASGAALTTARKEYRDRNRQSAARQAIPAAWTELVEKRDDLLVELLTDAVESKAGIRPDEKDVLHFFAGLAPLTVAGPSVTPSVRHSPEPAPIRAGTRGTSPSPNPSARSDIRKPTRGTKTRRVWEIADEITASTQRPARREDVIRVARKEGLNPNTASTQYSRWARFNGLSTTDFSNLPKTGKSSELNESRYERTGTGVLQGKEFTYRNAKEAMVFILRALAKADSSFLQRCSEHPAFRGRTRRHIARNATSLYPGRPDLTKNHGVLPGGWVVGTNLNNQSKMRIIRGAAEVAGITFGRDLIVDL